MRAHVHVRKVDPAEEWLSGGVLPLDEVFSGSREVVVAALHPFRRERAGILYPLFPHPAPARQLSQVVLGRSPAVEYAARSELFLELGIRRVVGVLRVLFGIEVIEVTVELVEAMDRRQKFVLVAQVVLAELVRRVAKGLEQFRDGRVFGLQTDGAPGMPTLVRPVR
jgi:hypothetical protein